MGPPDRAAPGVASCELITGRSYALRIDAGPPARPPRHLPPRLDEFAEAKVRTTPSGSASGSRRRLIHPVSFTFDGTFATQYDDYFITRIANSANTGTQFWGLAINYSYVAVGGCQELVQAGNDVLWAFDAFSEEQLLKLTGPATAPMGKPVTVRVTDGSTGAPVQGATVGGQNTGAQGNAQITFTTRGDHTLKAEHPKSIRSNAVHVNVT